MEADVTWFARRWIRRHGGRVYVWATPAARGYKRLRTATTQPPDVQFACETVDGIDVYMEIGLFDLSRPLRIERRIVPPWGMAASSAVSIADGGGGAVGI